MLKRTSVKIKFRTNADLEDPTIIDRVIQQVQQSHTLLFFTHSIQYHHNNNNNRQFSSSVVFSLCFQLEASLHSQGLSDVYVIGGSLISGPQP